MFLCFTYNTLCYMKHVVSRKKLISKTPVSKTSSSAGKTVLRSSVKSVGAVQKRSEVVLTKVQPKPVKNTAFKQPVRTVKPATKQTASAKPLTKTKTVATKISKPKAAATKPKNILTGKVSIKKVPASAFKQNGKQNGKAAKANPKSDVSAKISKSKKSPSKPPTLKKIKIAAVKTPTTLKVSAKTRPSKKQPVNVAGKSAGKNPKKFTPVLKIKQTVKKSATASRGKKSEAEIIKPKLVKTAKKIKTAADAPLLKNLPTAQMLKKMKAELLISAKANKLAARLRNQKTAPVVYAEKPQIVEDKISAVELPVSVKPKNRKAKPLGSAIFRGKKERYDFKMFALDEVLEAIPAVYIISKRTTDKRRKGHHALICIGETASIFAEIKKHRKGKCVKKHAANVVSILPEADEKTRLKIETDLKAAHTVVCGLD